MQEHTCSTDASKKTKTAFRIEPILGRVPRFTSRKPVEKLADTRTGFKKKNTLRENAAAALEGVESGRWTASNLHNSVNALYATFHTGCGGPSTLCRQTRRRV